MPGPQDPLTDFPYFCHPLVSRIYQIFEMSIGVLLACISVFLVHTLPSEARGWCQIPENWSYQRFGAAMLVLGIELRSSEREACVLTMKPSLLPLFLTFKGYLCGETTQIFSSHC